MPTRYICTQCGQEYDSQTEDGFCTNQPDCEYGSGWLKEITVTTEMPQSQETAVPEPEQTPAEPPSIDFKNEIGFCILMMDGSLSMGDEAFPSTDYPGDKYKLVAMNAAGGIWSLRNMTHSESAYIALCVFAGSSKLVWIKSVREIIEEFRDKPAFADELVRILKEETPEQKLTNIREALELSYGLYKDYLSGDLAGFGGPSDFQPIMHSLVRTEESGEESFISVPNGRVLIYTDGEHNVTSAVTNPFEREDQSVVLSAYIGEEDSFGIRQMKKIANVCPKHSPGQGFFLINSPERIHTLKGLFRMASGASGFCPACLTKEQSTPEEPSPQDNALKEPSESTAKME